MRCCCRAVWLLLLHVLLQSCAVCCAFVLGQDVPQYENKIRRSFLHNNVMITLRFASAKREPFYSVFQGELPLRRTRVGCLARSFYVYVCHCCVTAVSSCVIQHCFRPRLPPALNAHDTNASPNQMGSVHTLTQTKLSRAGAVEFVQSWSSYDSRCGNVCRQT